MSRGRGLVAQHLTRVLGAAASAQVAVYSFASFYSAILIEYEPGANTIYSIRLFLAIVYQAVIGLVVALDLGAVETRWRKSLQHLGALGRAPRMTFHVLYTVPLFSLAILFSLIACFVPYELESWFELPEVIVFPITLGLLPLILGYAVGKVVSSAA